MSLTFSLRSKFDLPAITNAMRRETNEGVSIEVRSTCIAEAARVCIDLQKIADGSAHPVPALQLAISREINYANYAGLPLACSLTCDVL